MPAPRHGVYVSFDDGDRWQSLQLSLPVTSVRDIDVHGDDLAIATHGRGFWILDDVSPLRQLTPEVAAADAWLFTPATAVRVHLAQSLGSALPVFLGTPMPDDEPKAANPPNGAYIDYALNRPPAGPVTLEIRDAAGALVRRWSSVDKHTAPNAATIDYAPEWAPAQNVLSAAAGGHRFVWNFTYAPPGGVEDTDGPWAPPGSYTAVLALEGRRLERRFAIEADPRVHLPAAAYRAQFEMAQRIERLRARLAEGAAQLQRLRGAVGAARVGAAGAIAARLDAFAAELDLLAGVKRTPNPTNAWSFPPQRLASFAYVGAKLQSLFAAVDRTDAAPSTDARAGWQRLQPIARSLLPALRALIERDLPALNAERRAAGYRPITLPAAAPATGT